MLYEVEEVPFYALFGKCVYHERVLDFLSSAFSVSSGDDHVVFFLLLLFLLLYLLNMVYYIG